MEKEINGVTYTISEAYIDDVDMSLLGTDQSAFQKSLFKASVKSNGEVVEKSTLKIFVKLMPFVLEINGLAGEEGND